MTNTPEQRIRALGLQLTAIEQDIAGIAAFMSTLPVGRLKAITDTLAEHERLIADTRRRLNLEDPE